MTATIVGHCADCNANLAKDDEASLWMRTEVLYDPAVLDVDNSGRYCPETQVEHVLAGGAS